MPFALDSDPSASEISEAINYLLSNFSIGNTVDPVTGQVVAPGGIVVGYIYQYLAVKYADDQFGTGFTNSPTGKSYYGVNNSENPAESSNPADYIWYQATGGFGTTKFLWYISTGGRQIQFAVSTTPPDTAWLVDPGTSIDLDIVTSGNIPVIAETFVSYFTPSILFVPRTGSPLTPQFTGIIPTLYATNGGVIVPYSGATTDSNVAFVNNSWRIGNSPTTGLGDISYTNITIGNPTDMGNYAEWPTPTAMTGTAYIDVPIRFKDSLGNVTQASVASIQLAFADPGVNGSTGPQIDFSGFTGFSVNNANVYTPSNATLAAIVTNVTSPTYSWSVTNATPTSGTSSTIVVTPNSSATSVIVSLTVSGTNLASPVTVAKTLPVTFDGVPGTAGSNGVQSAFPSIYIWTGSSAVPTRPSTTSTFTWATGAYTAPSGWSTVSPTNTTAGNYLWQITIPLNVSATTTTSTLDWTNTSYPIRCIAYNGTNGTNGTNGVNGTRTAILDMYKWASVTPTTFPSGTSTYTWATGQFTAPATTNGWSLTPPTAVLGQTLYIARTIYADSGTSSTSTVTWTASTATPISASGSNGADGTNGTNGTNGVRTAFLEMYQWSAATPTAFPVGTSTYTWANGTFTLPSSPNSWSLIPGGSTPGFTLYACSVTYADTATTATSTVTWSTSTAYSVGAAGSNGTNGTNGTNGANGSAGSATFLVTRTANDSSAPSNAEVYAVIGRNPVAGDIVTVSYNNANNAIVYRYTTSWITQATYLTGDLIVNGTITSNKLSVTQLSAISANLGTVTAGELQIGTSPAISGTTMSGSGAHIYSNGSFALGNSTSNIVFNSSTGAAYVNGFTTNAQAQNSSLIIYSSTSFITDIFDFTVSVAGLGSLTTTGTAYIYYASQSTVFSVSGTISLDVYRKGSIVNASTLSTSSSPRYVLIVSLGTTDWNTLFGTAGITYRVGDGGFINTTGSGTGTAQFITNLNIGTSASYSGAAYRNASNRIVQYTIAYQRLYNFSAGDYCITAGQYFSCTDFNGTPLGAISPNTVNISSNCSFIQIRV